MGWSFCIILSSHLLLLVRAGIYGYGAVFVDNFFCCVQRVKYSVFVLLLSHRRQFESARCENTLLDSIGGVRKFKTGNTGWGEISNMWRIGWHRFAWWRSQYRAIMQLLLCSRQGAKKIVLNVAAGDSATEKVVLVLLSIKDLALSSVWKTW
jgi:hypothetical protein